MPPGGRVASLGALYRPSGKSADHAVTFPERCRPACGYAEHADNRSAALPAGSGAPGVVSWPSWPAGSRVIATQVGHASPEDRDLSHAASSEPQAGRCAGVASAGQILPGPAQPRRGREGDQALRLDPVIAHRRHGEDEPALAEADRLDQDCAAGTRAARPYPRH